MIASDFRHSLAQAFRVPKEEYALSWVPICKIVPKKYHKKLIEEGARLVLNILDDLTSRIEKFIDEGTES